MLDAFSRTQMLIGDQALNVLQSKTVAIFGIGGVGSYATEALGRIGIGALVLIDSDDICASNINRQIHATYKTIGRAKVDVIKKEQKLKAIQ
ncbi:hypothetical protein AN641_02810 [Candidatus Epulonipiscioides gigas]|nr:hypothetical protein AN641_02810 [Epulopiscium sp. SCG-C07WGA-EpuloA2]